MTLKLYNTLTRKKEEFTPIESGKVKMYVCGITAYDKSHLGHLRPVIVFDIMYRFFLYKNFNVTYVRNYTDIDDKIINRANALGITCEELTKEHIGEYEEMMKVFNVLPTTVSPKATEHISEMISMIGALLKNNIAYISGGDVFFSVRKFKDYGKLSGRKIEELEAGARVGVDEKKEDPLDFALWKAAKEGEPFWESPWGKGRPGWHIECSAMSIKYLGQPFDIHGGGLDLVFPHHENEIAQAEGSNGNKFAKYWLHNGLIMVNGEKMSKSLGNFTTIESVLQKHDPQAVRYFILSTHYRSPLDYTDQALSQSCSSLDRFYETMGRFPINAKVPEGFNAKVAIQKETLEKIEGFEKSFVEAMEDDFNSAQAIGVVFDLIRYINRFLDSSPDEKALNWVSSKMKAVQAILSEVLGIMGMTHDEYKRTRRDSESKKKGMDISRVEALIAERIEARGSKNFKRSDEIRDELAKMGIKIKDKPDGTTDYTFIS